MFARVTRHLGLTADRVRATAVDMESNQLPTMEAEDGFEGALILADHLGGTSIGVTLWESETAMTASESAAAAVRESIQAGLASNERPLVARCEVVATRPWTFDQGRKPFARLNRHPGLTPQRVAPRIDDIEQTRLPTMASEDGFAGAVIMANHVDALVFGLTLWENEAMMDRSEPASQGVRDAIQAGLSPWERPVVARCEIVASRPWVAVEAAAPA